MPEELTLTSAGSITGYQVRKILFDRDNAVIKIQVADVNNVRRSCIYSGSVATTLMNQLNTINLSTNSLHKRILERLRDDGQLPGGTVTGTPDS